MLLAVLDVARLRSAVLAAALALLLIAPASWAVQTLGHATSGTFPAGGPATAGLRRRSGRRAPARVRRSARLRRSRRNRDDGRGRERDGSPCDRDRSGAGGAAPGGFVPGGAAPGANGTGTGAGGFVPGGAGSTGTGANRFAPGGGFGGGPFGSNAELTQALTYVRQHGGGTVGVSSQTGAASAIIGSGAKVAGLGGFSGRESEVSVSWLADAVRSGHIRWVLTGGEGGFGGRDGRVGSTIAMSAVAKTCKSVSSVSGLYDCSGSADALAAAA